MSDLKTTHSWLHRLTRVVIQHAQTLNTVVNILNDTPMQFAESKPHLSRDMTATRQCPPLLLESYKPVVTGKDGNCLDNALSLLPTSSQELHELI